MAAAGWLPTQDPQASTLTEMDKKHIVEWGVKNQVTFISLSLTKNADDVLECKQLLKQHNSECQVIAKLERIDALRNFDSILEVADAVILSRACLGLDVPVEKIALIQKLVR